MIWRRLVFLAAAAALLAPVTLAGKGGGKPGGGGPPPDPAIAAVRNLGGELVIMDADGANQTVLVSDGARGPKDWSPDGTQIAFVSDAGGELGIHLINLDGSGEHRILTEHGQIAWSPVATADGNEKLAIVRRDAVSGDSELLVANLDGTGLSRLTGGADQMQYPSWSPDADRIAVLIRNPRRVLVFDLGLVDGALAVTGSTDVSGPLYGIVDMPDWANTRDEIAVYVDNADNADDLWIIPVDDPDAAYPVLEGATAAASSGPSWSPDDSQILYGAFDPSAKRQGEMLNVLDLATGATTTVYQPHNGNLIGGVWRRNE